MELYTLRYTELRKYNSCPPKTGVLGWIFVIYSKTMMFIRKLTRDKDEGC